MLLRRNGFSALTRKTYPPRKPPIGFFCVTTVPTFDSEVVSAITLRVDEKHRFFGTWWGVRATKDRRRQDAMAASA